MRPNGEQRTTARRRKCVLVGGAMVGGLVASTVGFASPASAMHTAADVSVVKSCVPNTVVPGQTVTCTLKVQNFGPNTALNVVQVTDDLPAGMTAISAGGGGFTCSTGGLSPEVTCTRNALSVAAGEKTITVVARVNDSVGPETNLTDVATVTSNNTDPDAMNNTDSDTVSTPTCTINTVAGETTEGTSGADVICGTSGDDIINGWGGKDIIFGRGGADIINGGGGNDTIFGGGDDDILNGDGGNDTIYGGTGDDILTGGDGIDSLFGQDGDDIVDDVSDV